MEETNEIKVTVSFKTVPPANLSEGLGVGAVTYESEVMTFVDVQNSEERIHDVAHGFVCSVCSEVGLARPRTMKVKQTRITEMEL